MKELRLALAQVNPTVGDLAGNATLIQKYAAEAEKLGCDLIVFPEMALTGYPPEDLLLKPSFIADNLAALRALAKEIKSIVALVGFVDRVGSDRRNAVAWIENGRVVSTYHKMCLPNYGVFDEQRYFSPGYKPLARSVKGVRVGVTVCEDIWLGAKPLASLKKLKPDLVVNVSASPFHRDKLRLRKKVAAAAAGLFRAPLVYCNLVGGQDELVFDGGSFVISSKEKILEQLPQFQESLNVISFKSDKAVLTVPNPSIEPCPQGVEEIYEAILLAIRDYVSKNGFGNVTLGLSGGIDSALVAALATQALGPERVIGVTMPSRFNISETIDDARRVAENLKIKFMEIPIQPIYESFLKALHPIFKETRPNTAEENLQARIRGSLLMALSNKFSWLVLTTGNKSEISTGYCTLYGDTAGGFAVLKDLLKTSVYELAEFINRKAGEEIIPETTIRRAPTAELRENQKDEDSLGAYKELDPIIVDYIENNAPVADIIRKNPHRSSYIGQIISLIDRSEYKRRQAPPGIKLTPRSFGRDHRMPITNKYRPHK